MSKATDLAAELVGDDWNHGQTGVEAAAELHRLDAEVKTLRDALTGVLPWIVTSVVACNGLKCREPVCMSCNSDSEEAAERARTAYQVANAALGETK